MNLRGNQVFITGGGTGIGLALAEIFLEAGSSVIVCGRRQAALEAAKAKHPGLVTRVCDVSTPAEREELARWLADEFPGLNVLVNNAGIQQRINLDDPDFGAKLRQEIAVNLEAPLDLARRLLPQLRKNQGAAIVNVTSGLAFVPLVGAPVYCATKAGLHSFTLSLRELVAGEGVKVLEIIPPAVNTDLGGAGLHTFGVPLAEFAGSVKTQLQNGALEITHGFSAQSSQASRRELEQIFRRLNAPA